MEDSLLAARIEDALRLSDARYYPYFVGFLDERQAALARGQALQAGFSNYLLWGGYEGAQRVFFGAFPEGWQPETESFPFAALYITFRREDVLTHRDFLGTLMAQGIGRDAIGDIVVGEGRCVLFAKEELAPYITAQISKVGGAGIAFSEQPFSLPSGRGFEEKSGTVASARLDCVLSALTGLSREKCACRIASGAVSMNYEPVVSVSGKISDGEVLSVRGYEKYIVYRLGPLTKKGRLRLTARKYR